MKYFCFVSRSIILIVFSRRVHHANCLRDLDSDKPNYERNQFGFEVKNNTGNGYQEDNLFKHDLPRGLRDSFRVKSVSFDLPCEELGKSCIFFFWNCVRKNKF